MRILFVNSIGMFGGGEVWMLRTLAALRARGHYVHLACRPGTELAARAASAGIPMTTVRFRGDIDPAGVLRLARLMRREGIELVLTNMDRELRTAGVAARLAGRPAVVARRGIDYPLKNQWQYRFSYNVLAKRVIANSHATRQALLRNAPWLDPGRIDVIWNGVDMADFTMSREPSLRHAWGVPEETPVIGFVGQLDERKGIATLLEAFALVHREEPQARLVLVGRGPLDAMIRNEIATRGWGPGVHLAGYIEDVPAVMQAIDLLVLPSLWEGFGIVLIEAMAAGRPIVTTNVSSMPEIVVDGETGFLVPVGDAAALAARCLTLLRDAALRKRMGEAGRARVAKEFTHQRMTDRLEATFLQATR